MTDNDIIKALESEIHLAEYVDSDYCSNVNLEIIKSALDLITRQQAIVEKSEKVEYFADKTIVKLQAENERLEVENQSLRGAANSLKMHYEKAQANIERLKKYDEERDIRLHARLIANTKSETAKEVLEDLKKFMHNKFKDLDEYEFEYITERDIDSFLKMVGE